MDKPRWTLGPPRPNLSSEEVHVWRIYMPIATEYKTHLEKKLLKEDLIRLNKYHFNEDKERFSVARSGLRDIIYRYLNQSVFKFEYNPFGKPYLKDSHLQFNISHSADCILYAISYDNPVGIDVEQIKEDVDFLALAEHVFSEDECRMLSSLLPNDRCMAFYRGWTRKEAVIKMIGEGLSFPLKKLEVGFACEEPIQLLDNGRKERAQWILREIDLYPGYLGALAAEKKYGRLVLWDWQPFTF